MGWPAAVTDEVALGHQPSSKVVTPKTRSCAMIGRRAQVHPRAAEDLGHPVSAARAPSPRDCSPGHRGRAGRPRRTRPAACRAPRAAQASSANKRPILHPSRQRRTTPYPLSFPSRRQPRASASGWEIHPSGKSGARPGSRCGRRRAPRRTERRPAGRCLRRPPALHAGRVRDLGAETHVAMGEDEAALGVVVLHREDAVQTDARAGAQTGEEPLTAGVPERVAEVPGRETRAGR